MRRRGAFVMLLVFIGTFFLGLQHSCALNNYDSSMYRDQFAVNGSDASKLFGREELIPPEPPLTLSVQINCTHKKPILEIMFVQDLSQSFDAYLKHTEQDIKLIVQNITQLYPGSRLGLTSFTDKPVGNFGVPLHDYCYKLELPLTDDDELVKSTFHAFTLRSGLDWSENSLEAAYHTALDPSVKWSDEHFRDGRPILKMIVIISDSIGKVEGVEKPEDNLLKPFNSEDFYYNSTFSKEEVERRQNEACKTARYPKIKDLRDVLISKRITPVFLSDSRFNGYLGRLLTRLGVGGSMSNLNLTIDSITPHVEANIQTTICTPSPIIMMSSNQEDSSISKESSNATAAAKNETTIGKLSSSAAVEATITGEEKSEDRNHNRTGAIVGIVAGGVAATGAAAAAGVLAFRRFKKPLVHAVEANWNEEILDMDMGGSKEVFSRVAWWDHPD